MRVRRFLKILKCLPAFVMGVASIAFTGSVVQAEAPAPAAAAESFGTIVGLVTDAAKAPIGGATVTAIRAGGGIRSTISSSDGIYSFADVLPGSWSLTITVEGLPDVRVPPLNVVAGKATRHDIAMNIAVTPTPSAPKVAAAAPAVPTLPEALQAPEPGPEVDTQTPWANVGYVGWMNGTSREKSPIFDTKFFTPEVRLDVNYLQSLNHPIDHTIDGSTEEFRSGEFQIEQVSLGGDFHWDNVRARFLSMFGMFATTTPRNDASNAVGQWQLSDAYRYFSEANAGYHFDVNHGLNV
ncbi:MAG TPA: TonB-dependent receptor, partial [Steroidobacteraceae bacterium]|nr:TonB-dependent receptor [Steroidobacteraceae bacterium]